jgi:hypothetical protein
MPGGSGSNWFGALEGPVPAAFCEALGISRRYGVIEYRDGPSGITGAALVLETDIPDEAVKLLLRLGEEPETGLSYTIVINERSR